MLFNRPIMMPAQGLTLADSDDWRRVHRLDRLNRKKPAKLLDYQALTLIKGASRFGPVFFSFGTTIPVAVDRSIFSSLIHVFKLIDSG